MFMSQTPPVVTLPREVSVASRTPHDLECAPWCEDGCTVPQPPLRVSDPGLWWCALILALATGWLIG